MDTGQDPLQLLFCSLPSPSWLQLQDMTHANAFSSILRWFIGSTALSRDPEVLYFRHCAQIGTERDMDGGTRRFLGQIAAAALARTPDANDQSAKARYFRYALWVANGRQDHDDPYRPAGEPAAKRGSYATLPGSVTGISACSFCRKEGAAFVSRECTVCDDLQPSLKPRYCNKICEARDMAKHTRVCTELRAVQRATLVLQDIWTYYERSTFWHPIAGATEKNGIVYIAEYPLYGDGPMYGRLVADPVGHVKYSSLDGSPSRLDRTGTGKDWKGWFDPRCYRGDFVVRTFPGDGDIAPLWPGEPGTAAGHDVASAVLMHEECGEVTYAGKTLLKLFLPDALCSNLEEIAAEPKNVHTKVCRVNLGDGTQEMGMIACHQSIRATLSCGRKVAVDLTAAQHGWTESVALWDHYEQYRIHGPAPATPLSELNHGFQEMLLMSVTGGQGAGNTSTKVRRDIMGALVRGIRDWLLAHGFRNMRELVDRPALVFDSKSAELVEEARRIIDATLGAIRDKGIYRLYRTKDPEADDFGVLLTMSAEELKRRRDEGCWLTDEELAVNKGNKEALEALWSSRAKAPDNP